MLSHLLTNEKSGVQLKVFSSKVKHTSSVQKFRKVLKRTNLIYTLYIIRSKWSDKKTQLKNTKNNTIAGWLSIPSKAGLLQSKEIKK